MKWLARYSGITVLVLAVLLLSTRAFARDLDQDEALRLRAGEELCLGIGRGADQELVGVWHIAIHYLTNHLETWEADHTSLNGPDLVAN